MLARSSNTDSNPLARQNAPIGSGEGFIIIDAVSVVRRERAYNNGAAAAQGAPALERSAPTNSIGRCGHGKLDLKFDIFFVNRRTRFQ